MERTSDTLSQATQPLDIGPIRISQASPPLVIAEIGINHGGNLDTAKLMVDAAFRAGCRCIKHQTHIVEDEMSSAARQVIPGNADVSIYDIMASCALPERDEYELMRYTEEKGMVFLSTPFSRAAADRLEAFGVTAYKIGSGECNNHPLIEHIAGFGKPMLVSTGMNDLAAVEKTVAILERYAVPYALLHATNLYPTPPRLVRLGAMCQMMQAFPKTLIGLSDHSLNNNACLAATALGAAILERHFTDVRSRPGPDIPCSMDETELADLIASVAEIHEMRGGEKSTIPEEQVTRDFAFATVVSVEDISPGECLTRKNIWVKRPGTGSIPAARYESVIGLLALRHIPRDTHLDWDMIGAEQ